MHMGSSAYLYPVHQNSLPVDAVCSTVRLTNKCMNMKGTLQLGTEFSPKHDMNCLCRFHHIVTTALIWGLPSQCVLSKHNCSYQ